MSGETITHIDDLLDRKNQDEPQMDDKKSQLPEHVFLVGLRALIDAERTIDYEGNIDTD